MSKVEELETEINELEKLKALLERQQALRREVAALTASKSIQEQQVHLLVQLTAKTTGITSRCIYSRNRTQSVCWARFIVWLLARQYTNLTVVRLGEMFDGRDHGAITHGLQAGKDLLETDKLFKRDLLLVDEAFLAETDNAENSPKTTEKNQKKNLVLS